MFNILALLLKVIPFFKTKAGAYLIAGLLVVAGSGYAGWWVRDSQADSEKLAAVSRAIKQAKAQWEEDKIILEESAEVQVKIRTVFRTITKEIPNVEVIECTDLGDDWRRVYNDAVRAATEAAAN